MLGDIYIFFMKITASVFTIGGSHTLFARYIYSSPFVAKGHMTYPPLNVIPDTS